MADCMFQADQYQGRNQTEQGGRRGPGWIDKKTRQPLQVRDASIHNVQLSVAREARGSPLRKCVTLCSVCPPNESPGVNSSSQCLVYLPRNHLQKLINRAPLLTHADLALLV